jgi:hydroxybutyrate-dimer hydrolase
MNILRPAAAAACVLVLAACTAVPQRATPDPAMFTAQRISEHRGSDDLLTAGLGIEGLRAMVPPAFADADHPTAVEVRRRAIWSNWRGIADLTPAGGYGVLYGSTANVPGREFSAFARIPGAHQPHRVLVQVPDGFDRARRCVLVAPSSGSRGVYGAIAIAGAWGLPKGCAIAYTDKGTGTDYFDLDARAGARADGTIGMVAGHDDLAFVPDAAVGASGVAVKHAHSRDNPEADWGRHVRQAAEFALHALGEAFPADAPFRFDNTRVIAIGISNGGGAVLRAAELEDDGWLDAVVAGEPEVHVDTHGGRALYDYATQAALLMPCALLDLQGLAQSPLSALGRAQGAVRCASLAKTGVLQGADSAAQSRHAHALLRDSGWTDAALHAGALSIDFDLWRAVAVTYASAYGRYGVGEHPCGFGFSAQDKDFTPRAATEPERAVWWSDAAGIPPGAGVGIIDRRIAAPDLTLPGLQCLRALWEGDTADAQRVHKGIDESRAGLPSAGLPVVVLHGTDDGLVPPAFSSAPYVAAAKAAGRDVRYWQVRNAQHFDAFLALPEYGARYLPLLPYVYAALDRVDAHLDDPDIQLPSDAVIASVPRGDKPMTMENLAIPR